MDATLPSPGEQQLIMAQAKQDEELDQELLRRLEARRKARREKQGSREEFPSHMERRERTLDLPEEQKRGLKWIRDEVTQRLRFEKPHVYVEVIRRPQHVVPDQPEEGVRSMPPPLAIVEGCKYDFSVVAAIGAMKFAFHVPTYRQQDWFAQCGWFPARSTVNDLLNYAVDTVSPLYQQMWLLLLEQPILLGDDTRVCVLLRGALSTEELAKLSTRSRFRMSLDVGQPLNTGPPGSATSYAWLYTSLDGLAPYNVFHWSLTHQNAVIDGHLATYRGMPVAMRTRVASSSRPSRMIRSWRRRRSRSTSSCTTWRNEARRWTLPRGWRCDSARRCRSGPACGDGWTARRLRGCCREARSVKPWATCGTSGRHCRCT